MVREDTNCPHTEYGSEVERSPDELMDSWTYANIAANADDDSILYYYHSSLDLAS